MKIPVRDGAPRCAAAAGGNIPHGMPESFCELEPEHEGPHACRVGEVCVMLGIATTTYSIGSAWRSWS
jgi:hypothetical protein